MWITLYKVIFFIYLSFKYVSPFTLVFQPSIASALSTRILVPCLKKMQHIGDSSDLAIQDIFLETTDTSL